MTWNATRIGEVRARMPDIFPDHHVIHIAPNAHEHINTKGVITIKVSPHREIGSWPREPPAAGISRRTFYRFFDTRRALFAHVLQRHAVAIGEAVRRFTAGQPDFAAAIVEGTMETLRLIEVDIVFAALADARQ